MHTPAQMRPPLRHRELPNIFGLAGAVAGLLAGAVMVLLSPILALISGIDIWLPPKLIAATIMGPAALDTPGFALQPILIGALIHFVTSVLLGFAFGLFFNRLMHLPTEYGMPLMVGLAYGVVIFMLAYGFVLPAVNPILRDFLVPPFLAQNIVFGVCVGLFYTWLRPKPYDEHAGVRADR